MKHIKDLFKRDASLLGNTVQFVIVCAVIVGIMALAGYMYNAHYQTLDPARNLITNK